MLLSSAESLSLFDSHVLTTADNEEDVDVLSLVEVEVDSLVDIEVLCDGH